jgi:hypothetical protein
MIPLNFVERIPKVYLEKAKAGVLVFLEGIPEGVSHNLDPARATHAVVTTRERL